MSHWYRDLRNRLNEVFIHEFKPSYTKGKSCEIFKNPTAKEYRTFEGMARGFIIDDRTVILWKVYDSLHQTVRDELKLSKDVIPIVIYGDLKSDVNIEVTDNIRNSELLHTPLSEVIRTNAYIQAAFRDINVSYFDEAIVGSWDTEPED